MKQLEYVTKDHIVMHTILFELKMALSFSFLMVYVTVLNILSGTTILHVNNIIQWNLFYPDIDQSNVPSTEPPR